MIYAIFACDDNWGIGKNNSLPWPHNSDDLKWFKNCTSESTVVMGRKTWESLPVKPLPKRNNIVCSTNDLSHFPGADAVMNINAITQVLPHMSDKSKWIIGGAQLFESCIDIIDEIWLSRIEGTYNCDTFLSKDLVLTKFEFYEHYFDGKLTTEKYRRKNDEAIS
jgi:dihydrofolate reductase